jgi:hypothetical protein
MYKHFLFIFLLFLSLSTATADSKSVNQFFDKFKTYNINTENTGHIGELVAEQDLLKLYPKERNEILIGIKYFQGSQTIGELDVTIIDRKTGMAIGVIEVKTNATPSHIYSKAQKQLERFVAMGQKNDIKIMHNKMILDKKIFSGKFFTEVMGPASTGQHNTNYDRHLSLNHQELKSLLQKLALHKCSNPS